MYASLFADDYRVFTQVKTVSYQEKLNGSLTKIDEGVLLGKVFPYLLKKCMEYHHTLTSAV